MTPHPIIDLEIHNGQTFDTISHNCREWLRLDSDGNLIYFDQIVARDLADRHKHGDKSWPNTVAAALVAYIDRIES